MAGAGVAALGTAKLGNATTFRAGDPVPTWVLCAGNPAKQQNITFGSPVRVTRGAEGVVVKQTAPGWCGIHIGGDSSNESFTGGPGLGGLTLIAFNSAEGW